MDGFPSRRWWTTRTMKSPLPPLPRLKWRKTAATTQIQIKNQEPRLQTSEARLNHTCFFFSNPSPPLSLWSDFGIVLTHLYSAFHPFLPSSLFNQSIKTCFFFFFKISISLYHHQSINQPTNQPCWPYKFIWIPPAPFINHYVSFFFFFFCSEALQLTDAPGNDEKMDRFFFSQHHKKKK